MRLDEWLQLAESRLATAGVDSAKLDAQLLAAHVLAKERSWIITHPEAEISEKEAQRMLERRENREPLAYLIGVREFFGRAFKVTNAVLIPRQETETLVEAALSLFSKERQIRLLDFGTGSGCIAISLKLERPNWDVWSADTSPEALEVARANAEALHAEVTFVQSDYFSNLDDVQFDLIVTNPPYIGDSEVLMPEVGLHEPPLSLFSGPTGLESYLRLAKEASSHLEPQGQLLTEVGDGQSGAVQRLFEEEKWLLAGSFRDLGGTPRALLLAFQPEGSTN